MAPTQYSSKLFQFVMRRSRHLRTQVDHAYRQAAVAAKWGLESAAATVHGFWKWGQHSWQQLQLTAQKPPSAKTSTTKVLTTVQAAIQRITPAAARAAGKTPPSSVSASATIRKVLQAAAGTAPGTLEPSGSTPSLSVGVQGIATDLTTGRLAWVTPRDVVVLDRNAHRALAQKISEELQMVMPGEARPRWAPWQRQASTPQILGWIWQATLHFFGRNGARLPTSLSQVLGHPPDRGLGRSPVPTARLSPTASPRQSEITTPASGSQLSAGKTQPSPAQIAGWIWHAVLHFLGRRGAQLPLDASQPPAHPPAQPLKQVPTSRPLRSRTALSAAEHSMESQAGFVAPIPLPWRWLSGILFSQKSAPTMAQSEQSPLPSAETEQVTASGTDSPGVSQKLSSGTVDAPRLMAVTSPSAMATADRASPMTDPTVADWLDVSATTTGYSHSFLGWLLVFLDQAFTQIERALAWLWEKLLGFFQRWK